MGVIVKKENDADELSRRINADLRERQVAGDVENSEPVVDFMDNSEYLRNTKKTGRFGWVWAVLIVLAIMSIVSIVLI